MRKKSPAASGRRHAPDFVHRLGCEDRAICRLLSQGYSKSEIAGMLGISERTFYNRHILRIRRIAEEGEAEK